MKNIPDQGFEQTSIGNFCISAFLAHTGIRGDEDTLLILNPSFSEDFNDFNENIHILYKFGKLANRQFVSWQDALVDLDHFNKTGEFLVLQKWSSPILWKGEIIICSPNKRIEKM